MKAQKDLFLILLATAVLLLGMAGIYLSKKPNLSNPVSTKTQDSQTQKLQNQQNSDDTASIEKDLKDTDLSTLDKELQDIEKELLQF